MPKFVGLLYVAIGILHSRANKLCDNLLREDWSSAKDPEMGASPNRKLVGKKFDDGLQTKFKHPVIHFQGTDDREANYATVTFPIGKVFACLTLLPIGSLRQIVGHESRQGILAEMERLAHTFRSDVTLTDHPEPQHNCIEAEKSPGFGGLSNGSRNTRYIYGLCEATAGPGMSRNRKTTILCRLRCAQLAKI